MLIQGLAIVGAGLLAWLLTPWVRALALKHQWLDRPGPRSSHQRLITRGGGLALVSGFAIALLLLLPASVWVVPTLVTTVLMTVLGWLDDVHDINVRWRLVAQILIAMLAVYWVGPVEQIRIADQHLFSPWLWTLLSIPALIWMVNLFNFMDGADGLASAQGFFSGAFLGALFVLDQQIELAAIAFCLSAASFGFFLWNRPPARIFLGDAGSLALGWTLGFLALAGVLIDSFSVAMAFMAVAVFVIDASATLIWRVVRKEQWYTAHRDHAYQQLIRKNWSHRSVLLVFIALNLLLVTPGLWLVAITPSHDWIGALVLGVAMFGLWFTAQTRGEVESRHSESDST